MQTKNPWEHDNFWPYIHRCLLRGFFVPAAGILDTLQNHPNADLAEISKVIANSLRIFPRSHNVEKYPVDHLYLDAHARWLSRFQNELVGAGIDPAASEWLGGGADLARTEKDLRTLVDIMEGKAEKVLEQSDNWREALGAWGILVKVNMSRDEVPYVPPQHTLIDKLIEAVK
jgi:nuclear pore complex protein Nup85